MLQPVILCGGVGSRLWPLSRTNLPKPFIRLDATTPTLFQQTVQRVTGPGLNNPLVICAEEHRFYVLEQLDQLGLRAAALILEPTPRGTAAAIATAAFWAHENAVDGPLVLVSADHLMGPPSEFQTALASASPAARNHIVLFGITPTHANTEYGYVKLGASLGEGEYSVAAFLEKPTRPRAEQLLKEGGYFWNSGIFTASAKVLAAQFQAHAGNIWHAAGTAWQGKTQESLFGTPLIRPAASFAQIPQEAFDTAVMERTATAAIIPFTGRWSDIGTWSSYAESMPQDESGNSTTGHVLAVKTAGSLIHNSTPGKIIAVQGLEGIVIVDTPDALLVTTKTHAAEVKSIFTLLQKHNLPQANQHARVVRPWGWYETIASGPGFLVKRIGVNPAGRLSLQYHNHRSEHWVVTSGTASVTHGTQTFELHPDQSTYIPQGTHHRLENHTEFPLEIVEVQTGPILEESDIVRLDDIYQRQTVTL